MGNFMLIIIVGVCMEIYFYVQFRRYIRNECNKLSGLIIDISTQSKDIFEDVGSRLEGLNIIKNVKKAHIFRIYKVRFKINKDIHYMLFVEYREGNLKRRYAFLKYHNNSLDT